LDCVVIVNKAKKFSKLFLRKNRLAKIIAYDLFNKQYKNFLSKIKICF
jgi:hypothetical protein